MAVMLTAMVGCQKDDEIINVQNNVLKTFYATFENGAETRTSLDVDNNVLWSTGDQISVFAGSTANNSFILKAGENTTYGEFKVNSLSAGTESNGSTSTLSANVAYYPYDSNVTVSENNGSYTFNAAFPASQTYAASGTFGNGASPMVAVTSSTLDADLKFKNVGAIFRLQLKGEATITKVVFGADANLAGDCEITASYSAVPTVSVTEGSNTIVLDCGEGVQLDGTTATNFIVAMLPVENVTGGMTITIYDNAGKKMVYTHKEDETITIERSKAYTTAEVTYSGNQDANTATSVQAALDAAIDGTTIQLEPGVNYGTLYIRPVLNAAHTKSGDWFTSNYRTELCRKVENLTILGASGAKVDAIEVVTGYKGSDYITEAPDLMCYADIKNLVIDGVEFTDNTTDANYNSPIYIDLMNINLDGLTVKNCKLNGSNEKTNLVYIYGSQGNHTFTTASKNVTITSNTVEGIARLCELRGTENVTITDNIIKNTAEHAILLAGSGYSGNVTITDNKADGIADRFVRMSGAGDATVTITGNVITNYKGEDYDYIKVTDSTVNGSVTVENNTCSYTVSTATEAQAALDAAISGSIIQLEPNVTYGKLLIRPVEGNANTISGCDYLVYNNELLRKVENLTIMGASGATVEAFEVVSGHIEGSTGYVVDINNLVIDGIEFTDDHTNASHSYAAPLFFDLSYIDIDGLTVKNCKLIGDNDYMNFVYLYSSGTVAFDNVAKNITITENSVDGIARLCELRQTENVTITDNIIKNTALHAILLSVNDSKTYSGNVTITGNKADGIGNRFVRMAGAGDAKIFIKDNEITNYQGTDSDYIKVTDSTTGGSLTNENNTCS